MLLVGYTAEIYECSGCGGEIEVIYNSRISPSDVKMYRYAEKGSYGR